MEDMTLFEEETEIYNSKIKLLNWLYNEIKLQTHEDPEELNQKGQTLPLNL